MFQKVNEWLTDRTERFTHGGNAASGGAYYASSEAEQAYGGAPQAQPAQEERFAADANDPYGGRVPYRSQRDMQAEAEMQRQQMEEQARRQQAAAQQRQMQQFGRPQGQAAPQTAPQQQANNVLPFPGLIRGPEGNLYAHVEYVVLLRNRNECTKVIEYIKSNASVFLNMEFIANDSERQRCVDMLSGAAYTLGCRLNKISQRGIYLISSPSVYVVVDPAMQKYTAAEAQGYRRADYGTGYAAYGAGAPGYGYAQQQGYAAAPQAPQYAAQPNAGYAAAPQAQYGAPGYGYAQQPNTGYAAVPQAPQYAAQPNADYAATPQYAAQPDAGFAADADTGAYQAQPVEPRPRHAAYDAQGAYWKGYETAAAAN